MQIVTRNEVSVTLLKMLIISLVSRCLFMGSCVSYIALSVYILDMMFPEFYYC